MLQGPWTDYEAVLASTESAGSSTAQTAAVVEALWKAAGQLAEALAEEGASAWCENLALAAGIDADGSDVSPGGALLGAAERAELELASPAAPPEAASPVAAGQEETSQGPDRGEQGAPPDEPSRREEKGERLGRRGSTSVNLYSAPEGRAGRRPVTGAETAWLAALSRSEDRIREELAGQAPLLASVAARFEADLLSLVQARRWAEHASNPAELGRPETAAEAPPQTVTEADRVVLESIRARWYEAVGFQLVEQLSRRYAAHLRQLKDRRVRAVTPPPRAKTRKAIADAAASLQPSGLAEAIM